MAEAKNIPTCANQNAAPPRPKGFIVFCETTQRYEGGPKVWLFLGPYFFGAYLLYATINAGPGEPQKGFLPWLGFLAYLVLFPSIWKWVLNRVAPPRARPSTSSTPSTRTPLSFANAAPPLPSPVDEKIKLSAPVP